jgi:allene oxide cyclase-like protein
MSASVVTGVLGSAQQYDDDHDYIGNLHQDKEGRMERPLLAHPDAGNEVIQDLTEQTLRFEAVGTRSPRMQTGDGATFYNEIYDSDDNVVGDTVGLVIALSVQPSDGHMITEYREAINLLDGTLRSSGVVDRDAMLSGTPIRLEVVGTSGKYLGRKGFRECQLLPPYPPTNDSRVSVKIVLHDD